MVWRLVALCVLRHCCSWEDIKTHTEECRSRIGEQMGHEPEGHERSQVHRRRRDVEPEVEVDWAPVATEKKGDPALVEQQDVEMPVETPVESASVKSGSDVVADNEERAEPRADEARNTIYKTTTKARLEPRRIQKKKHATPPRSGGRGHVDNSCWEWLCSDSTKPQLQYGCSCQFFCGCERGCRRHGINRCPYFDECWNPTGSSGTVGSMCFNVTDLVSTSEARPRRPSRESVQGLVKTCLVMCAEDLTEVCSSALFKERSM